MCVCFLDLKIYENPTHIGRVSAWSKTGAAIFILKIDVRKKIEQPPITNSIDSSKPSNSKSPWWARRRRSWSTLRKSSAPAKQDWESFFFCKIMLLQTQYSHIFKTCLKYAIFTIILCVLCVFFSELFFCSGSFIQHLYNVQQAYICIYHGAHSAPKNWKKLAKQFAQ